MQNESCLLIIGEITSVHSGIQKIGFLSYRQGDREFYAYCHPIRTIDSK